MSDNIPGKNRKLSVFPIVIFLDLILRAIWGLSDLLSLMAVLVKNEVFRAVGKKPSHIRATVS